MWRRGVGAVLADAGFATAELEALADWKTGRGGAAVVLHVEEAAELEPLVGFAMEHPHIPVIVVAPNVQVAEFAAAIKAGGTTAIEEGAPTSVVIAAIENALAGMAIIPPTILRALSMRIAAGFGEALSVSDEDIARIRALAGGTTVAQLAGDSGFSEREMFRILSDLYGRIGAANRTEAILWASRYGMLDD